MCRSLQKEDQLPRDTASEERKRRGDGIQEYYSSIYISRNQNPNLLGTVLIL